MSFHLKRISSLFFSVVIGEYATTPSQFCQLQANRLGLRPASDMEVLTSDYICLHLMTSVYICLHLLESVFFFDEAHSQVFIVSELQDEYPFEFAFKFSSNSNGYSSIVKRKYGLGPFFQHVLLLFPRTALCQQWHWSTTSFCMVCTNCIDQSGNSYLPQNKAWVRSSLYMVNSNNIFLLCLTSSKNEVSAQWHPT